MGGDDFSTAAVFTKSFFLCLFIIIAIIGNGSVLYAIQKYPKLKTVPNYFVFNLAVADLLFSITGMPMILITTVSKGWILGNIMCDFGGLLNSVFCTTSIWTLVMISMHRYFSVAKAVQVKRMYTKVRTCVMIVFVWLFAFMISMPPLLGWSRFVAGSNFCTVDGKDDIAYSIFLLLTDYFFPFLFLTLLYLRIFFLLRTHEKVMKKSRGKNSDIQTDIGSEIITSDENEIRSSGDFISPKLTEKIAGNHLGTFLASKNHNISNSFNNIETKLTDPAMASCENINQNLFESKERSQRHISFSADSDNEGNRVNGGKINRKKSGSRKRFFREVRVTKMLLIVVCGFFLCWTPFLVAATMYAFNAAPSHMNLLTVGIMFACTNSIINPIIYAVMNQNFRFAFKSMGKNVISLFQVKGFKSNMI